MHIQWRESLVLKIQTYSGLFFRYLLAVGLETGAISLYSCCPDPAVSGDAGCHTHWSPVLIFPSSLTHTSTVKRLQWSPLEPVKHHQKNSADQEGCQQTKEKREGAISSSAGYHSKLLLASCSTDHSVKLFQVNALE